MNKNYFNHLKTFQLLRAYIARIEHDLKYTIPHNPQTYTYMENKEVDKTFCEGIPFITIDMASHIFRSIIKEMEIMDSLEQTKAIVFGVNNSDYVLTNINK